MSRSGQAAALVFFFASTLLRVSWAATTYSCTSKLGTGNQWCSEAANLLIEEQTGCDGNTWIPSREIREIVYLCKVTLQAFKGSGVVVSGSELFSMYEPLLNRCGSGSFCDSDTGICGTLTTSTQPGRKRDAPGSEPEFPAVNSSAVVESWVIDFKNDAVYKDVLAQSRVAGFEVGVDAQVQDSERKLPRNLSKGWPLARRQNGCKVPANPNLVIYRVNGRYRFQRITVLGENANDRAPPSTTYTTINNEGQAAIRRMAGQANNNPAQGRADGDTAWGSMAAAPQTGAGGANTGYPQWTRVAVYFDANVLVDFVRRSVNDMAANHFTAAIYEIVDSGNNGVVRLVIYVGRRANNQPKRQT